MTRPTITRIVLSVFVAGFILVACNSNKKEENKESTVDTTKMETPKMDTMNKMDTGGTKPTQPGN